MNQQQRKALHRQLDQALDSIAEATRRPGGLEGRVEDLARSLSRALMEEAIRSRSEQTTKPPAECPECSGTELRPVRMHTAPPPEDGGEKNPLLIGRECLTGLGPISYRRRAWRCACPDCGAFAVPVDRELGLLPKEHATAAAREKMALLGATESYAEAALKLEKIAGLKACPKEIQRITVREGRRAQALLARQETEARSPAPDAAKSTENHDAIVLEMDGTCVLKQPSGPRKNDAAKALATKPPSDQPPQRCRGREVKCATVFGLDQRLAKPHRPTLAARRYAATARGIEAFAASVYALLLAYGGARARRIAVLGDGAEWIWNWVRDWLHPWTKQHAEIVEIVDFWHAAERLSTLAKALFGEGTEEAKQWLAKWRHRLHEGEIDAFLAEMGSLAARWKSGRRRQACLDQLRDFSEHRERMRYERFRAMNLPIGSGAIEGTCKCLIKKRMATSGMHWGEEQIEPLVALRTVLFNHDWELLYNESAA